MKLMQYFFVLLFSTIQLNSFAQTLKIVGDTVGIEPGNAYQYHLDVSGLPSGATNRIVNWVLVGNIDPIGISYADGDPSIIKKYINQVKWDNKANGTNVFTIQATLNWTEGSTTYSKDSPKKQIQVKHIGPINNLTVSGSSYGNGHTHNQACGTSPITVTSAVPVTSPSATVQYVWTFPSGWSPGSIATTTPSTTVTPTGTGEGVIKVVANRTDGTTLQTISVNVRRPLATISSLSQESISVCNSSTTVNISASGSNAESFRWEPSAAVKINGVNATTTTSSPVSVTSSAEGHVDVYAYNAACGLGTNSKRLHVRYGVPVITERLINGIPEHLYVPYYPAEVPNGSRIAIPSYNAASYSWTLLAGTAPLWPVTGNEHMCDISYIIDYARIEGKATNACGSATHLFYLVPPGGSMLVAYPNPATETLTLQLSNLPQAINLYTETSTIAIRSFDSKAINDLKSSGDGKHQVIINVKDLPRGIYYLHVDQQDKKTEKIRVQLI